MTAPDFTAAADLLLRNWSATTRIAELPEAMRPQTRAEGYEAAAAVARAQRQRRGRLEDRRHQRGGAEAHQCRGADHRPHPEEPAAAAGRGVRWATTSCGWRKPNSPSASRKDLPPRAEPYSQEEALDAVGSLHLSIEVPDSRYQDFTKVGAAQLIADTACASWLVLGPAVDGAVAAPRSLRACGEGIAERRAGGGRNGKGGARRPAQGAHLVRQRGLAPIAAA